MTEIPVAILAGGMARRLRPLTDEIPKVLLPVAGRPFLEHQLEYLRGQGIAKVVLCIGHLGEMVRDRFGNGSEFGIELAYSFDGPVLLGTAGALQRALPLLAEQFFVLYGDSYLTIDFAAVARSFARSGKPALLTVHRNRDHWDISNAAFNNGRILRYDKQRRWPELNFVDYGLSMFHVGAFDRVPAGQPFDLADLLRDLAEEGELAGFEARRRFYEIGSHAGLAELDGFLSSRL